MGKIVNLANWLYAMFIRQLFPFWNSFSYTCSSFPNILPSNWFRLAHSPMFCPSKIFSCILSLQMFLNHGQVRAWFLLYGCLYVCVCVCPPPRKLITSGAMWHNMDPIPLVKQVLQLLYGNCIYVVSTIKGCSLGKIHVIETNPIVISYHCTRH